MDTFCGLIPEMQISNLLFLLITVKISILQILHIIFSRMDVSILFVHVIFKLKINGMQLYGADAMGINFFIKCRYLKIHLKMKPLKLMN